MGTAKHLRTADSSGGLHEYCQTPAQHHRTLNCVLQPVCALYWGNVCPVRARRATFLLTIPTSAQDLPSDGEGAPNRP